MPEAGFTTPSLAFEILTMLRVVAEMEEVFDNDVRNDNEDISFQSLSALPT